MQPSAAESGVDDLLDKQEIIACIKEMGSFESGFENNYEKIIDYACKSVEASILPTQFANAAELIFLAAAKAYYAICVYEEADLGFASFTAGDITVSGMASKSERAKEIYKMAVKGASAYLKDDGFAFKGV